MVMNPLAKEFICRYPDESLLPTALTHFTLSSTITLDAPASGHAESFRTFSAEKLLTLAAPSVSGSTGGCLYLADDTQADYGTPHIAWAGGTTQAGGFSSIDRTLASCIRVRVVGLPTSTFLPSGSVYFLQLTNLEFDSTTQRLVTPGGESVAMQAVAAGKGFCVTTNEISKSDGGITHFSLPFGPNSYVYSDTNMLKPALSGRGGNTETVFGGTGGSSALSSNGFIMVIGYGLQPGTVLRFDYAHVVEYVPTTSAAGVISTQLELPSMERRQDISLAIQKVNEVRAGSTSLQEVQAVSQAQPSGIVPAVSGIAKQVLNLATGGVGSTFAKAGGMINKAIKGPAWLSTALDFLS